MVTTQPKNYQPAAWRGATPYHADTDRMGVCFDLPDGQVIRLAISRESAAHLVGAIADYLAVINVNPLKPLQADDMVLPAAVVNTLDMANGSGPPKECKITIQAIDEDSIRELFELHSEDFVRFIRQGLRKAREGEDAALGMGRQSVCETCRGTGEIRRPYSAVERIPCPTCGVGQDAESQSATWVIDVQKDGVHLRRMHNGVPCESYRVVSPAVASIWVAAIIQGYQPPRGLLRLDKPVG